MPTFEIRAHVVCLASLCLLACSNELTRPKAQELIIKRDGLPQVETVNLPKEYMQKYKVMYGTMRGWEGATTSGYGDDTGIFALQDRGVLTVGKRTLSGINSWTGEFQDWTVFTIELTPEGRKYVVADNGDSFTLKADDLVFGQITGIQTQESFGRAEVGYTIARTNISPFARNVSEQTISRSASFSRFDDGWRIVE